MYHGINRLKQYRRATRYEKRAENYEAMLTIAASMLWLWIADPLAMYSASRHFHHELYRLLLV